MRTAYITYKSSLFFAFVFFFLDVDVRFISQCELTNNGLVTKRNDKDNILVTVSVLPW